MQFDDLFLGHLDPRQAGLDGLDGLDRLDRKINLSKESSHEMQFDELFEGGSS